MTVYQYKRKPKPEPDFVKNRVRPASPATENLTGMVRNMEASAPEERFALALEQSGSVTNYQFRYSIFGFTRTTPGAVEIDFVVYVLNGQIQPIQIDGEYAHKSIGQREEDKMKDARLNEYGQTKHWLAVIRIPAQELDTQDMANAKVKELFG
jgi:hypothetical protein